MKTVSTQSIQAILAPYHRHKFRLDCGHQVTLGYFLGNNLIILNGKQLKKFHPQAHPQAHLQQHPEVPFKQHPLAALLPSYMKGGTPMRILKIETCKSLSGGSNLTYHIGSNEAGDIYVRLYGNSSSGLFSKQWIPIVVIEGQLQGNIASRTLKPLYEGKSINSPGFVLAVLLHESLVRPGVSPSQ